jgi:iron complex transport system ATP-binding protein
MIQVENLSIAIEGQAIVREVSAAFSAGKISVIMGPNGAGKSTLLSAIAGLNDTASGQVRLGDIQIGAMPVKQRAQAIGLLPQSGTIAWDLTVAEFVALGRMPFQSFFGTQSSDAKKITAAMDATDTEQFANRKILSLSGGERARVLLARVIAGEPQWLLADEPLANLDLRHQLDLLALLRAQANAGTGVIAVLHDLSHAARVADHVVLLAKGSVVASGPPAKVLTAANIMAVYNVECQSVVMPDKTTVFMPIK